MRLFVSVPVSEEVRTVLARAQELLRGELAGIDLRFLDLEQSHLTLRFLGEIAETDLPDCRSAVAAAARSVPPFNLRTAGFGVFPGPGRPGVLWLGVEGDTAILHHLHEVLERRLTTLIPLAGASSFRPHLTLCRVKQRLSIVDRKRIAGVLSKNDAVPAATWRVASLQLIRSSLLPAGAVHTSLQDEPLVGGAG